MKQLTRRTFLAQSALASGAAIASGRYVVAQAPSRTGHDGIRMIPADHIFTVADTPDVYHHSAGIVSTQEGLVCIYRTSDQHIASWVNINMARSRDGGRTWQDHRVLSETSFAKDRATWVAPQTSQLRDGRIAVLVDRGEKHSPFDWPALSQWQMPDHGMSNWLLTSADHGATWEGPRKVDDIGGEPSYIISEAAGPLLYTRTDSRPTSAKKNPSMPWGANYYRSTGVISDDHGKTFARTALIFDDPLIGDCEVGVAEYAPGKLIAISRIGDGGSAFNQPSRMAYSRDGGRSWSKPRLSPIYAHRPCVRPLAGHGHKLFVTFRAASNGTTGTFAWKFDPEMDYGYQPNSFVWDERCCVLEPDGLHLRTEEGSSGAVEFSFYPMEDDDSACELRATLAVIDADAYGCNLCAGTWIRLEKGRVSLADRESAGFDLDATRLHDYRIVAEGHRVKVFVDGTLRLDEPTDGIFTRNVRAGNRRGAKPAGTRQPGGSLQVEGGGYSRNRAHTIWKSLAFSTKNRRDHSATWGWKASSGKYPDQFRRDRVIVVERNGSFSNGNSGYSSWTQDVDGTVVIADYSCTEAALPKPILRAYRLPSTLLA
jgi:hypothetical protein